MELDVRRLKVLREVALLGTIAAAADSLGFTPSAISQQVAALQRELGVVLVERSGRGVRLTRDGQVLVARTEAVLRALDEAGRAGRLEWESVGGKGRRRALRFSGGTKLAVPCPVEPRGTANPIDNCVQRWSGVFYRSGRKPIMEIPGICRPGMEVGKHGGLVYLQWHKNL